MVTGSKGGQLNKHDDSQARCGGTSDNTRMYGKMEIPQFAIDNTDKTAYISITVHGLTFYVASFIFSPGKDGRRIFLGVRILSPALTLYVAEAENGKFKRRHSPKSLPIKI